MKIQKSSKGEWVSTFGGLLIIIGIMCMVFETKSYFIFGFLITGIIVTGYGVVRSFKENGMDDNIKK